METQIKIHAFEAAGLGKAPFRFVGIETATDRAFVQKQRESDGMIFTTNFSTSCDFCGQGIQNAYQVRSADGKQFKVGCDCIRKTGDKGLIAYVTEEESNKRREKSREKRQAKWQREAVLIQRFRDGLCEPLRGQPHPKGREGATAYDYVEWCVTNHCCGELAQRLIAGVTE